MLQSGSLMHGLGRIVDPTLSEMAVALVSKESASRNAPLRSKCQCSYTGRAVS